MFFTEGVEERDTVVDDWIDVRDMKFQPIGKSMTLVIESTDDESSLGEVDGG